MSKRLQVLLDEPELRTIQRLARREGMTTADWVRRALRSAQERETGSDPRPKLAAIRAASQHAFPTADIEDMLAEIARGRADEHA